jgi:hypothetical protein
MVGRVSSEEAEGDEVEGGVAGGWAEVGEEGGELFIGSGEGGVGGVELLEAFRNLREGREARNSPARGAWSPEMVAERAAGTEGRGLLPPEAPADPPPVAADAEVRVRPAVPVPEAQDGGGTAELSPKKG